MKKNLLLSTIFAIACFFIANTSEAQTKDVKKDSKGKKETSKSDSKTPSKPTSNDKVVGKDAKGRDIYEGSRGGRYTLSENGNKNYIKKEEPKKDAKKK